MIYLYHKFASRIVKAASAAIPGDIWATMERITVAHTRDIPARADLVVTVGKATPPIKLEWWAANKGGFVCRLPEADDYLSGRATDARDSNAELVLLDGSLYRLMA